MSEIVRVPGVDPEAGVTFAAGTPEHRAWLAKLQTEVKNNGQL